MPTWNWTSPEGPEGYPLFVAERVRRDGGSNHSPPSTVGIWLEGKKRPFDPVSRKPLKDAAGRCRSSWSGEVPVVGVVRVVVCRIGGRPRKRCCLFGCLSRGPGSRLPRCDPPEGTPGSITTTPLLSTEGALPGSGPGRPGGPRPESRRRRCT